MSTSSVCEHPSHAYIRAVNEPMYEDDVARRWFALPRGIMLPLHTGEQYQLVFSGYAGGAAGPDVHDAVLSVHGQHVVGDIEFHIRSSDWTAHRHESDMRYNHVILHVVLICDDRSSTVRQDGTIVPLCSLQDIAAVAAPFHVPSSSPMQWPCQQSVPSLIGDECQVVLQRAGILRFEQKTERFVEHIRAYETYDAALLIALAEALGYGRDRAFFLAAGQRLLGLAVHVPEPLGRAEEPSPLDGTRLRFLRRCVDVWPGWASIRELVAERREPVEQLASIRSFFCERGLSLARTDILLCNVLFPFAAAVALLEHDTWLGEQAKVCYLRHPGLTSNRITRLMCRQLLLPVEPRGSCQQQGLHYIYQETCREKRCAECIMGRGRL